MYNNGEQYRPIKSVRFHDRIRRLAKRGHPVPDVVSYYDDPVRLVVRNQLIAMLPTERDKERTNFFIKPDAYVDKRNISKKPIPVRIVRVSHCNPNLVLLNGERGDDIHFLIGKPELRYSPDQDVSPPHASSIDISANDVHYSPEQDVSPPHGVRASSGNGGRVTPFVPVSFDDQLRRIREQACELRDCPIVAIMDTGIDFRYPNTANLPTYYNSDQSNCDTVEPDYIGWDFINDHNYPYDDNLSNKHGSRIAAIISKIAHGRVQVMPLKVIDNEGIGDFFAIFSAFEYVLSERLHGRVSAVNASWGFYSQSENELLSHYTERLAANNIWLINAAGNRGDIIPNEVVNLDRVKRFPACYSPDFTNVLTVTTASNQLQLSTVEGEFSIQEIFDVVENYSPHSTDMGAGAGRDGKFKEPLVDDLDSPPVSGSSYATAYVSGFVAGLQNRFDQGKLALMQNIPDKQNVLTLASKIRDGYVFVVESDSLLGPIS